MINALIKFIWNLVRFLVVLGVLGLIFHTWVIRQALKYSLGWQLGAPVEIEAVKMDWKHTGFEVHNLEIGNPYQYSAGLLADIPLVIISVDITKIPEGILHLKTVGINLRELVVSNYPGKGLNVMQLKPLRGEPPPAKVEPAGKSPFKNKLEGQVPRLTIDELILSFGAVTLLESNGSLKNQKKININIQGEAFHNLSGSGDIVSLIAAIGLKKAGYVFLSDQLQRFSEEKVSSMVTSGIFKKLKNLFS